MFNNKEKGFSQILNKQESRLRAKSKSEKFQKELTQIQNKLRTRVIKVIKNKKIEIDSAKRTTLRTMAKQLLEQMNVKISKTQRSVI